MSVKTGISPIARANPFDYSKLGYELIVQDCGKAGLSITR